MGKLATVSYTHLDVYKRQLHNGAILQGGGGLVGCDLGNFRIVVVEAALELIIPAPDVPVSYTHLDVYKRQHPDPVRRHHHLCERTRSG